MHPDRSSKPTQPELLGLESFLRSRSSGDSAMNLSRAHGCLAAIVSGPKQFEAGEWIRLIFDKPVFDDSEQAQDILGLIMRLHVDIEHALPIAGRHSPIFGFEQIANAVPAYGSEEW
jgi:yecA family protein